MIKYLLIAFHLLTTSLLLQASESMNGITLKQYQDFESWKLVTVKYRKDNKELRFIYANPEAYQALVSGTKPFPEGSVLAKVAYLTQEDPAFEASMGPSSQRRIQFMVKDNTNYRKHRGWGYALFDTSGQVFAEPIHQQVNACAACHDIVPERDYVFSNLITQKVATPSKLLKLSLKKTQVKNLPHHIQQNIPKHFKEVLLASHQLIQNVFQGTLDEMKPVIAKETVSHKMPVLFGGSDLQQFLLIYPEDLKIECNDEGASGLFVVSKNSLPQGRINTVHFCQPFSK